MCIRLPAVITLLHLLAGWGTSDREPAWPHSGPMPDAPVKVKPLQYESIGKGNQSYRPIDPMPWGDVNKRVAPKGSGSGSGSGTPPAAKQP